MTRRALLAMLAGAAGVAVADPERLLWVPGRKLISIPAPAPKRLFTVWRYTAPDVLLPRLIATIDLHADGSLVPAYYRDLCGRADYDAIRATISQVRAGLIRPGSGHARVSTNGITIWDTTPVGSPRFLPRVPVHFFDVPWPVDAAVR